MFGYDYNNSPQRRMFGGMAGGLGGFDAGGLQQGFGLPSSPQGQPMAPGANAPAAMSAAPAQLTMPAVPPPPMAPIAPPKFGPVDPLKKYIGDAGGFRGGGRNAF